MDKKKYRVNMALELVTEDDGKSIAIVNVIRMSNDPVPLPMMTNFINGLEKLAPKVMLIQQYPQHGKENNRPASNLDCEDFEKEEPEGHCDGMGHYLCDVCRWRNPESIRQRHEEFLLHMAHKKE